MREANSRLSAQIGAQGNAGEKVEGLQGEREKLNNYSWETVTTRKDFSVFIAQ